MTKVGQNCRGLSFNLWQTRKAMGFSPHSSNAHGPFYVANGECISCGAPELEAPLLMSHDQTGHCFFVRQPGSTEETNAAIRSWQRGHHAAVQFGTADGNVKSWFV